VAPISRKFDVLFRNRGSGLPVPFLRALAKRESNLNPSEATGCCHGLLQVHHVILKDFNKSNGTEFQRSDLLDPRINVTVGASLLAFIGRRYEQVHGEKSRNMRVDFTNVEFVRLLLAGWNSGFSEKAGVGHVAGFLEENGIEVTHENIFAHAKEAGGTRHLANERKKQFQAGVAGLFFSEVERDRQEGILINVPRSPNEPAAIVRAPPPRSLPSPSPAPAPASLFNSKTIVSVGAVVMLLKWVNSSKG